MKAIYETIKCPECGFENVIQSKKCKKCHRELESFMKTCPRCAKRNKKDAKKCDKCGFNFKRKQMAIWSNLLFTLLLVAILIVLLLFNQDYLVSQISMLFRVVALIIIVVLFISTLTYGKKEIVPLPGDETDAFNKRISFLKVRNLILFIILLIVGSICVYYVWKYIK